MRKVDEGSRLNKSLSIAALFFVAIAQAGVDGTVVNGTTGKPQPGTTVTLFRVGQNGPESIQSVKSDAEGHFAIAQELAGPRLLQMSYGGVTYNRMLPPGTPSTNLTVEVYNSSNKPGKTRLDPHMILLEPAAGRMVVSESYVFINDGTLTFNDPVNGTLQFYLPPEAGGQVNVNVLAPQGMPIRRAADKTSKPNVYKVDFPLKPGESHIDLSYSLPFTTPGTYTGKVLFKGGTTRIVAPAGVTLKGDGLQSMGQEPRTKATIYDVKNADFSLEVEGSGALQRKEAAAATDEEGPGLSVILPKLYGYRSPESGFWGALFAVKWIVLLAACILSLGFVLLYRARVPEDEAPLAPPVKGKSERSRR